MRCSAWRWVGPHNLRSACSGGTELQIAFDGKRADYVVKYDGRIVRHGSAKSLSAAKRAARKQAGAKGGVP